MLSFSKSELSNAALYGIVKMLEREGPARAGPFRLLLADAEGARRVTRFKQKLESIVPRYAVVPLAVCLLFNILTYYGCRLLTRGRMFHEVACAVDAAIPLFPPAIVIYVLTYVFWIVGFVVIARGGRESCFRNLAGEQTAKLLCIVCFLAFPTAMERPDVRGRDVFSWLTRLIYRLDDPNMLFPSIHCLDSWFCFRGAMRTKGTPRWYRVFAFVFALLVFASTLLVKQHVFFDVLGGVVVLELGLFISNRLRAGRVYERLTPEGRR